MKLLSSFQLETRFNSNGASIYFFNLMRDESTWIKFMVKSRPSVSGVARVLCALGQEIFLHPISTKLTEFELKDRCKSA